MPRLALFVGLLSAVGACRPSSGHGGPMAVAGSVVSEAGAPVVGAQVTVGEATVVSDAQGHFEAEVPAAGGAEVAVGVEAVGFSRHFAHLTLNVSPAPPLVLTLRPLAYDADIALPQAGEPPLTVTVAQDDSSTALTLAAGDLVRPDGSVASGTAHLRITYWNPAASMATAPGPLAASGAATPQGLASYGMADIEVEQEGELLQVAGGHALPWSATLPPASRQYLASHPARVNDAKLWYLNPKTALFDEVAALGQGVRYDAAAGVFAAALPHLSIWNFDMVCTQQDSAGNWTDCIPTTANGGCLAGTVTDCDGRPLANTQVRIWASGQSYGKGSLKDFLVTTDARGGYCQTVGTEPNGPADETMMVHLSGADSPDDSNLVCPIEGSCKTCNQEPFLCNSCGNGTPSGRPSAAAQYATVHRGATCAGGSSTCTQLPQLRLGAACHAVGACQTYLPQGSECGGTQCCAGSNICADGLCVPPGDVPNVGY